MMPNSDYIGRYGAALRQLHALENPQPAVPSAFGAGPQPQAPAFSAVPPPSPAFSREDQEADLTSGSAPVSAKDLYRQMPAETKRELLGSVEKTGMDVDQFFQSKVDSGEIQIADEDVRKPLTKEQKLGYITEVALRTISNLGRKGTSGFSDFADARLATDARRGAIEQATQQQNQQLQMSATQQALQDIRQERLLGRQDRADASREARADARQNASDTRADKRQAAADANAAADRKNRLEIAVMEKRAGRNAGSTIIGEDGILRWVDSNGKARKVTEDDGSGKQVPVKVPPKFNTGGLDQDTIARLAGKQAEIMLKDRKLVRKLKDEGLGEDEIYERVNDMAFEAITKRLGAGGAAGTVPQSPGPAAPTPGSSSPNGSSGGQLPAGVPAGSVQIGTSGGKPVFQAPDGKRYKVE